MAHSAKRAFGPGKTKRSHNHDPRVEAIRAALEGPVIDVFRREIPELRHLPRAAAYDAVMNDPKMLDRCLRLFRARPELFADVVLDREQRPAILDAAVLSCGRTLAEVVALVVRASARRYFRTKLDIRSRFALPPPKPSLAQRLGMALGMTTMPAVKSPFKPPRRSEVLYRAIRDYLQFDWQVLLIPHYAPLTPALVADLGPRLLDIREAAELQALSSSGARPHDGRLPLLLDNAERLLMQGRTAIDAEIFWRVVQQMDLGRLFPNSDAGHIRRSVAQVSAIHTEAIGILMPVLGGDIRRFTAFVMIAFVTLGEQRFKQDFCQAGHTHSLGKLAERLDKVTPPAPSLDEMTKVYQAVLSTAYSGGIEAEAGTSGGATILKTRPDLKKALDALGPVSIPG